MASRALEFAADGRLAVFVGAGVSAIPPTGLPSWWELNRAVIVALGDRAAELVGRERAGALADAITARQEQRRFPPEYQAEVIVRRLRDSYFDVLRCLDSETPNPVHRTIAALARDGRVRAVLTTNFDRALEAAFAELGVPADVCSAPAHFSSLLGRLQASGVGPCPILKLHGSADDPTTLVDTLSQRKRGFSASTAACIRHLLRSAHWLFLGYSGADLEADGNYLFLRPDAADAHGFTWLLRTHEKALDAVVATRDAYHGRSEIVQSELPGWLDEFAGTLLKSAVVRQPQPDIDEVQRLRRSASDRVARDTREWAASQRFDLMVLAFAGLLDAVSEPDAARDLVQRLYDSWPAADRRAGRFAMTIDALANLSSQSGDLDRAVTLFEEALSILDPATFEEQHAGALNNLALVHAKRGRNPDALEVYRRALAIAEKSGNPAGRGVVLHNLGMIHSHLGQYEEAERYYQEELTILQALGDEAGRAFALNNLGELAVARHDLTGAGTYLNDAIGIRDRIGDDLGAAHSRANLANAELQRQSYAVALRLYEDCLAVFRRFNERVDVGRTLGNIARLKESTGERDQALALIDQSLGEADATGSDPVRAQALQLRGEIEQKQGHHEAAATTFAAVVALAVAMRDAKRERDARTSQAMALKALGTLDLAIQLLREARSLTERHALPASDWVLDHLADALNKSGLARQAGGELERALREFTESADIWRMRASTYNEGQTLLNIANTHVLAQQHADAAAAYRRTAAALGQADDREGALEAAFRASELFAWLGQLDAASALFEDLVAGAGDYAQRAERLNRIGSFANRMLEQGALDRGLWILEECLRLNRRDGYGPDVAACLINIGSVAQAAGNVERARQSFAEAVAILEPARHPMLELARSRLEQLG